MTATVDGYAFRCPVCGEDCPDRGYARRRIPWLGGKERRVHRECAGKVEAQATLDVGGAGRKRQAA